MLTHEFLERVEMGSCDPCQQVAGKAGVADDRFELRARSDCLQALELINDVADEPGHAFDVGERSGAARHRRPSVESADECGPL